MDSKNHKRNFYNLDVLEAIPIEEVCKRFDVPIFKKSGKLWCKIRNEKTPSCKLYEETNTFCDFGNGNLGGNTINFVAAIKNCSNAEAIELLAAAFDIEPELKTKENANQLLDFLYEKIGLYGDLATKNMDLDLEHDSLDNVWETSIKYCMSMNELKEKYPKEYESILRKRAVPFVLKKLNNYYYEIYKSYALLKAVYGKEFNHLPATSFKQLEEERLALEAAEKILIRAAKGTNLKFVKKTHDVQKDFEKISNGIIEPEIGSIRYFDLKLQAKKENQLLLYKSIPADVYMRLSMVGLEKLPHSAFIKKDTVNLVFLPRTKEMIFTLISDFERQEMQREQQEQIPSFSIDEKDIEISSLDRLIAEANNIKEENENETEPIFHNDEKSLI